jgi:hypothetical protein
MGAYVHWNLKDPTISKTFKCAFQIHINIPQCTLRGISVSFFRNSSSSSFFRAVMGAKKGRTDSQLVDDLNCVVFLSPTHIVLQELKTGRVIGIGKRSEGLYRLQQEEKK